MKLSLTSISVKNAMNYVRNFITLCQKIHVESVLNTWQLICSMRQQQMKSDLKWVKKSIKMFQRCFCCFCCKIQSIRNSVVCEVYKHKLCSMCVMTVTAACVLKKWKTQIKQKNIHKSVSLQSAALTMIFSNMSKNNNHIFCSFSVSKHYI